MVGWSKFIGPVDSTCCKYMYFFCKAYLAKIILLARSPASRLAGDFLVSYQPAVINAKVSYQPAGRRPESLLPASY